MSIADWYLVLFALGSGASIAGFWTFVIATGRLGSLIADRGVARAHAAAELASAALLIAGGIAALIDWSGLTFTLLGLGLGTLLYALIGSPAMYRDNKPMRAAFLTGWLFALPAVAILVLRA